MNCYNKKIASKTDENYYEYRVRVEKEQQAEQEYLSTLTEAERQDFYYKKRAERKHIVRCFLAEKTWGMKDEVEE